MGCCDGIKTKQFMKKRILFTFLSLLSSAMLWAADGDIFTVNTVEGVEMNFRVISEADKTCAVGTDDYNLSLNAIYRDTKGHVTIPDHANDYKVTSIGYNAFTQCKELTSITIPEGVTIIRGGAFAWCSGLTGIDIPEGVTIVEDYDKYGNDWGTFQDCTSLASVSIPSTVNSIGNHAFMGCYAIEHISVAEGNTVYDSRNNCNSLIETASGTLLKGCNGSTIPEGVTSIAREAFAGCAGLASINIPSSVTSIGYYAFTGCSGLERITVAEGNTVYDSRNDCNALIETASNALIQGCNKTIIPAGVTSIAGYAFCACPGLTSAVIPEGVTTIGYNAFYNCTALTKVTIPEGVTTIGFNAFMGCTGLISVIIPESMTRIEDSVFSGCTGLTGITIPKNVTTIGQNAFYGCEGITSITIPKGVTSIDHSFSHCTGLESIIVEEGNTVYDSRNGCNALIETASNTLLQGCNSSSIPSDVTGIGSDAFYGCTDFTSITIPEGVTVIGNPAFEGCTSLTSINLPASLTTIGPSAFFGCTGLTSVTIPEGVTAIYDFAFYACNSLTSVTFNCATVDNWFWTNDAIKEITLGENVRTVKSGVLSELNGLTTITILTSELSSFDIDAYNNCHNLTSVTFNGTSVGSWFRGIQSIKELTLGERVTSIAGGAFKDYTGLTSVTMLNRKPFAIDGNTFPESVYKKAALFVPKGTKRTFEAIDAWSLFANIEEIEVSVRPWGDVNGDYSVDVADISSVISVMAEDATLGGVAHYADVNKDGAVDVADISSIISIMASARYFYLGTDQPTADNYTTLPGVVDFYSSISETAGEMAVIAPGETLYMLCPASWTGVENLTIEDNVGNIVVFSEDVDATSIPGYVIYKTQPWSHAALVTVKLNTGYVEVKSVDYSTMTTFDGTIEKGKAEIVNYDDQNCLKVNGASNVRIIEGFEVEPFTEYTTTIWVKSDKNAVFDVVFSGNRIEGNGNNGRWSLEAGQWTKITVVGQPAEGETDGYLRIENSRSATIYISKVKVGYYPEQ